MRGEVEEKTGVCGGKSDGETEGMEGRGSGNIERECWTERREGQVFSSSCSCSTDNTDDTKGANRVKAGVCKRNGKSGWGTKEGERRHEEQIGWAAERKAVKGRVVVEGKAPVLPEFTHKQSFGCTAPSLCSGETAWSSRKGRGEETTQGICYAGGS